MVSISEDPIVINEPSTQGGKTLLHSLQEVNRTITDGGTIFSTGCNESKFITINLEHGPQGLGFNIVGGKDSPHIPGHSGIFVSIIKPDSPAYNDGKLSVGDLVLSVNGIELVNKTHDEAVSIFRSQKDSPVELLVEIGAENRILNERLTTDTRLDTGKRLTTDTRLDIGKRLDNGTHLDAGKRVTTDTRLDAGKSFAIENSELTKSSLRPHVRRGDGFSRSSPSPSNVHDVKGREEDNESVSSCAPSVQSYLDDVPRTPKRPMSYLDPRNPSLVTEVLYVSIGLAVISLGLYLGSRFIRRRS